MSEETQQKIVARQIAHENRNLPTVRDLSSQIKNLARRDRRNAILESIQELVHQREKWSGIENMKNDPQPTYLQDKHWTNNISVPGGNLEVIQDLSNQFDTGYFIMTELDAALPLPRCTNNLDLTKSSWNCSNW